MKRDYAQDKHDHNENSTMFAKLQHHHHHQNFHSPTPPPPPSQPTFHHPFHVSNRDCQTSEEADSHQSPANTPRRVPSSTTNDGATIEVMRRQRGRPAGSKNKPKPPIIITRESQPSMSPYVLEIPIGVDIIDTITCFTRKRNIGLTILNGSGTVSNVTLRQPSSTPGATVTFHGRFDILSLSATVFASQSQTQQLFANGNGFSISLAGPQGQVFGGAVVGTLVAATTVFLIATTFNTPAYCRLPFEDDEERNINEAASVGDGNEGSHQSPPQMSGGGGDGGIGGGYSRHLASDVIWTPTIRQPPPY